MKLQRPSQEAWDEFTEVHSRVERTPAIIGVTPLDRGLHGAMGLAGESGEALELFKKYLFRYKQPPVFDGQQLIDELGDAFWYFALILDSQHISFDEILEHNAKKLKARYAERFAKDADSVTPDQVCDAV